MAATNINRVVMTGNLTADPELRSLPSGTSVCKLRVACNTRRKDGAPASGTTSPTTSTSPCGARRARTRHAICPRDAPWRSTGAWSGASGRPRTGAKRQAIDIIADSVQFLGSRDEAAGGGGFAGNGASRAATSRSMSGDFQPAPVAGGAGDDDIPF